MSEASPFNLPYLEEIFQHLCRGRHICVEDGNIYFALHDNAAAFQDLFNHLGFEMEVHSRDFYYFKGGKSLSGRSEKMALFIFILMEYLEGQGESVEEGILTKTFSISELPHFSTERYRGYMKEIGIEDSDGLAAIVSNLDKFGFAQRRGDIFRFRSPIYRFFDICSSIVHEGEKSDSGEREPIK
jgi:hypothetical protein